jgi:hypothetical protein
MPVMTNRLTTISVSKRNRLRLMEMGRKGQSFDVILTELLEKTRKEPLQTAPRVGDSDGQSAETKLSVQTMEMAGEDGNY